MKQSRYSAGLGVQYSLNICESILLAWDCCLGNLQIFILDLPKSSITLIYQYTAHAAKVTGR